MRIKLDEKYLNSIKQKIIVQLGLNSKLIDRMNQGSLSLYVENLQEQRIGLMVSRKNEIAVDKELVLFDKFGNVIGLKKEYFKLIESQLGHELMHAASRGDGYVGINNSLENTNRGLNEGITQMFTEDVFGYVVSRFTDAYGDYKKIAKIMRLCVGNEVFRSSFFEHTNKLKDSCNSLASNTSFYDEINKALTDLYYLRHSAKGKTDDQLNIIKNIYAQRMKLCYENIILNMVIPRIKKFKTEKEAKAFLTPLLNVIADDKEITREIVDILKEKLKLNEQQLNQEKKNVQLFAKKQKDKHLIFHLVSTNSISKSAFLIDSKGQISYKNENNQCIEIEEDEELYSYIYDYLFPIYFKNFDMDKLIDDLQRDNELILSNNWNQKQKRIFFCRLKKVAKTKGLEILNSYFECDNNKLIKFNFINKDIRFNDLKKLVERYELKLQNDESVTGEYIIVDKVTNKIIKNQDLAANVKFAYLWLSTGKNRYVDETIPGITDAFSEDSKKLYEEISNIMIDNVRKTGNIDLDALYIYAENHNHSRMHNIVQTILKNPLSYEWVYGFIKQKIGKSTLQTEKEKSYVEQTNSEYQNGMIGLAVDEILSSQIRR